MRYEVRKNDKVYMTTSQKRCHYSKKLENAIQASGYDIYIDGKKQLRRKSQEEKYVRRY